MRVPWCVLTHPLLQKLDVIVYAALTCMGWTDEVALADSLRISEAAVLSSLSKLCELGYVSQNCSLYRVGRAVARTHPNTTPYGVRSGMRGSDPDQRDSKLLRGGARVETTRVGAKAVYEQEKLNGTFSVDGLLGLFYSLYLEHVGLEYRGTSVAEDRREVELLVQTAQELAPWCIRAFFSEHMAWVKNKSLSFLGNANHVHRFVIGIAQSLRGSMAKKPEWTETASMGLVHRPLR